MHAVREEQGGAGLLVCVPTPDLAAVTLPLQILPDARCLGASLVIESLFPSFFHASP